MRILTTTTLACAISLGLGSAAFANEGAHKDKQHASQATMQTQANETLRDANMMGDRNKNMRNNNATAWETRLGKSDTDRLTREFRELDRDNDGFVMVSQLDSGERTELQRFDADDDNRMDRYEFVMAKSARFEALDANKDGQLSRSEVNAVKPEYVTFVALDVDNNQQLSKEEYRQFIESGDWVRDRDRYAFGNMDRDNSGSIDKPEASVYVPLASSFSAYDPDGDGLIESTEYEVFLAEIDAKQLRDNRVARADTQAGGNQNR